MAEPRIKTMEITVSRTIATTPERVFDTWLDAKSPGSPWHGPVKAIVSPVVDGLFYHAVHFEGHEWAHYGRFIALDRPQRIQHTWVSEATRGLESVVTLTIAPQADKTAGKTLVTLNHRGIPDDPLGRRHEEGWNFVLGAMAERFG
jgi:uncharacterized protein YndB with AHSA1/START domain